MIKDTGLVTIYDTKNDGKPLQCFLTDAREFLEHPSGRWSADPSGIKKAVDDSNVQGDETGDSGEAMRLKGMDYKALQSLAIKHGIPANQKKEEIINELLKPPSLGK